VCVIDIFNNHVYHFPLIKALAEKYGKKLCAYCQHQVCECIYSCRNEPTITRINRQRLKWGLRDWQQHLDSVYGPVNRTKGIEVLLTRLQKEVLEVLSVEMNAPYDNISLDQIEMEFARELADTLAWLLAVASYYDIDLRSAVEERYGSGC
jgi:NTP pyrophosphatase (non-canonical NTP hydrolase)